MVGKKLKKEDTKKKDGNLKVLLRSYRSLTKKKINGVPSLTIAILAT